MAELSLNKVVKEYGPTRVIHGVELDVKDGEFVVLVGPSGCGKSTLLRIIAGLDETSGGSVHIGGSDVTSLPPGDRGIAMVFQSYALYPHMTVRQNLAFGLENTPMSKSEIAARVENAAQMLEIEKLLDRRPKALSGGQRQRVAIGRAIVRDPKVFLFDEPLSNLDAALRVQTRGEISRLHKRLGATMVYVTHDQIEAMTMADRIAVLNAGVLEQFGEPLELFNHPVNKFVAGFIGSPKMNFYDGQIVEANAENITLEVPGFGRIDAPVDGSSATPGKAAIVGVRPNHFHVVPAQSSRHKMVDFEISYTESVGTETYLFGRVKGNPTDSVLHLPDHVPAKAGDVLPFGVEPERFHVFDAETERAYRKNKEPRFLGGDATV